MRGGINLARDGRALGHRDRATRVEAAIANLKAALEPNVITDGRNLWVHWTRIDNDALIVRVDVKLPFPGGSTAYYDQVRARVANL